MKIIEKKRYPVVNIDKTRVFSEKSGLKKNCFVGAKRSKDSFYPVKSA